MAKNITGNNDGTNGENDSYTIRGRGSVPRDIVVEEVKQGKHPHHSLYPLNGETYVRAKPNSSESDNVNKD